MRTCFFIATKTGTAGAILASAPNVIVARPMKEKMTFVPGELPDLEPIYDEDDGSPTGETWQPPRAPGSYAAELDGEGEPVMVPAGKRRLLYNPAGNEDPANVVEVLLHRCRPVDGNGDPVVISRAGSDWTVWLCIPTSLRWRRGPRMLRKLVRAKLGADVLGPFTRPELLRRDAAMHDLICPGGTLPHQITGDDPVAIAAIDYAPSQADADADVEPSVGDLFGEEI